MPFLYQCNIQSDGQQKQARYENLTKIIKFENSLLEVNIKIWYQLWRDFFFGAMEFIELKQRKT